MPPERRRRSGLARERGPEPAVPAVDLDEGDLNQTWAQAPCTGTRASRCRRRWGDRWPALPHLLGALNSEFLAYLNATTDAPGGPARGSPVCGSVFARTQHKLHAQNG